MAVINTSNRHPPALLGALTLLIICSLLGLNACSNHGPSSGPSSVGNANAGPMGSQVLLTANQFIVLATTILPTRLGVAGPDGSYTKSEPVPGVEPSSYMSYGCDNNQDNTWGIVATFTTHAGELYLLPAAIYREQLTQMAICYAGADDPAVVPVGDGSVTGLLIDAQGVWTLFVGAGNILLVDDVDHFVDDDTAFENCPQGACADASAQRAAAFSDAVEQAGDM